MAGIRTLGILIRKYAWLIKNKPLGVLIALLAPLVCTLLAGGLGVLTHFDGPSGTKNGIHDTTTPRTSPLVRVESNLGSKHIPSYSKDHYVASKGSGSNLPPAQVPSSEIHAGVTSHLLESNVARDPFVKIEQSSGFSYPPRLSSVSLNLLFLGYAPLLLWVKELIRYESTFK
jgi:hypothetical protein